MRRHVRNRFWLQAVAATITATLTVVTLISREWIELVFGFDPDNHSGSLEWLIVAACLATTVGLFAMARQEWRAADVHPGR